MATEELALIEQETRRKIAPLAETVAALVRVANDLVVDSDEADVRCGDLIAHAATIRKELASERTNETDPYEKTKKLIIATFKPTQEAVDRS